MSVSVCLSSAGQSVLLVRRAHHANYTRMRTLRSALVPGVPRTRDEYT